jgi:hypothetical protein
MTPIRETGKNVKCLFIFYLLLQDSQLDHFAPFSWTDFVEYMRVQRSGRRRSTRRVSRLAFIARQIGIVAHPSIRLYILAFIARQFGIVAHPSIML